MKKLAIMLCILAGTAQAGAQWRYRHNSPLDRSPIEGVEYHDISRTWQTIDLAGENTLLFSPTLRGIAITTGHSFLVHERPLLRIVHLGFDVTWFDIEYGGWRQRIDEHRRWMHKIDMAIGAGPAVHLSPSRRFGVHLYFHYDPTVSMVTHNFAGDEDGKFELVAGYASYFSTGLAVSWSAFAIGGEYRYGGGTYRGIRIPDITVNSGNIEDLIDFDPKTMLDRQRHTMRGWRAYISFRF